MQSGETFSGQALTWIQLVEGVSGRLGSIHTILTALKVYVAFDADMFKELTKVEWGKLEQNMSDVKAMIQPRS